MKLNFVLILALISLVGFPSTMTATANDHHLPRKVLVGTCIFPLYEEFPGIDKRLQQIETILEAMGKEADQRYSGRSLDVMLLPEYVVTGGLRSGGHGTAENKAISWEGPVADFFAAQARKFSSYIAVPMHELRGNQYYNSIILVDREGKRVGTYDKCLPVVDSSWNDLEEGITPGREAPVFDCDFGRLGFQICYDISAKKTWKQLADAQVELVGWCTASPQTILPQMRAVEYGYWIVSSTMRNNATIFQPKTGFIHAQITQKYDVLVSEIDLSYLRLEWMPELRHGECFREKFGDRVGFQYEDSEDNGLFWSNDPNMSIDQMAEEIGILQHSDRLKRSQELNPYR